MVLVAGEGRAFCAGFDLDEMRGAAATRDKATADLGRRMVEAVEAIPAITVALVQGHCVGGGLLLAAACDLRMAAADAQFSIPELEIGIPLAWGGVPRLGRVVGPFLPVLAEQARQLVLRLPLRAHGRHRQRQIGRRRRNHRVFLPANGIALHPFKRERKSPTRL